MVRPAAQWQNLLKICAARYNETFAVTQKIILIIPVIQSCWPANANFAISAPQFVINLYNIFLGGKKLTTRKKKSRFHSSKEEAGDFPASKFLKALSLCVVCCVEE